MPVTRPPSFALSPPSLALLVLLPLLAFGCDPGGSGNEGDSSVDDDGALDGSRSPGASESDADAGEQGDSAQSRDAITGDAAASADGACVDSGWLEDAGTLMDASGSDAQPESDAQLDAQSQLDAQPQLDAQADAQLSEDAWGTGDGGGQEAGDADAPQGDGGVAPVACTTVQSTGEELFYAGNQQGVRLMRVVESRLLSQDFGSIWILWDTVTRRALARGRSHDRSCNWGGDVCRDAILTGGLLVVPTESALELRDGLDGHPLGTVAFESFAAYRRFGVASDGSYVWTETEAELHLWSRTGVSLLSRAGDYRNGIPFAAPDVMRIGNGAAGADVVESIAVSGAIRSVSPTFLGGFAAWFGDGGRFLTAQGTTVRVYSSAAVQQKILTVSTGTLGGYGDYFWSYGDPPGPKLAVYSMASGSDPILSVPPSYSQPKVYAATHAITLLTNEGLTIANWSSTPEVRSVDWSVREDEVVVDARGDWIARSAGGAIEMRDASGHVRKLSCGKVRDLLLEEDGSWSVATGSGEVLVGNLNTRTLSHVLNAQATSLSFNDVTHTLAARHEEAVDNVQQSEWRLFDYNSGALLRTIGADAYMLRSTVDLAFAQSSARLARSRCEPAQPNCFYYVEDNIGQQTLFTSSPASPALPTVALSPDGTYLAAAVVTDTYAMHNVSTSIFHNADLVGATAGYPLGWLSNGRLLLDTYKYLGFAPAAYKESIVVDEQGAVQAHYVLPETTSGSVASQKFSVFAGGSRFFAGGKIYDADSGAEVWAATRPADGKGAANDTHVIYVSEGRVMVVTHP